jgi:uncharacterized protein YegL
MRLLTVALATGVLMLPVQAPQTQVFRSGVDVVFVPVSVTDRNRPVPGLTAADFELLDNDVTQQISVTATDAMPTDVTFVVDTSGSISGKALERIKLDVQAMVDLLQPSDRVRLVSFARDATDLVGLRPAGAVLDLSRMIGGGTTSLYDALVSVLAAYPSTDRPHLVFAVTDGRDNSSFSSAAHVVEVARRSSAVLCLALVPSSNPLVREAGRVEAVDPLAGEQSQVALPSLAGGNVTMGAANIAANDRAPATTISRYAGPYRGGPNRQALDAATTATGGLVYPDASRTPVPELFRRVLDDFRASYVITYTPTGVARGGLHTVTVRARNPRLTVRARKYYEG